MKKILGALVCMLTLVGGAMEAKAELLTNWTYDLTSVSLNNVNSGFVSEDGTGKISFASGSYNIDLAPGTATNGSFTVSNEDTSASSNKNDQLVSQSTAIGGNGETPQTKLADLTFSYSVVSVTNPAIKMNVTYSIPLYTFASSTGVSYVFYNNAEVSSTGATAITHDGYKYGITGFGLFVDGRAFENFPGGVNNEELFSGWAINEDTFYNNYSKYVVGGDNTDTFLGEKATEGAYSITGIFSMAIDEVTPPPAPTPEPATMLLMGAGLVGLGLVARRRNSK